MVVSDWESDTRFVLHPAPAPSRTLRETPLAERTKILLWMTAPLIPHRPYTSFTDATESIGGLRPMTKGLMATQRPLAGSQRR